MMTKLEKQRQAALFTEQAKKEFASLSIKEIVDQKRERLQQNLHKPSMWNLAVMAVIDAELLKKRHIEFQHDNPDAVSLYDASGIFTRFESDDHEMLFRLKYL